QLSGAHNLTLSASSGQEMSSEAKSGAKGSTAVTPVVAISISDNETDATVGTDSHANLISITGNFSASAVLTSAVETTAEGDTQSDDTGVGISIAVTVVNDNSLATTGRDLHADGTMGFSASTISSSDSSAKASVAGAPGDNGSGASRDGSGKTVDGRTTEQLSYADSKSKEKNSSAKGTESKSAPSSSTSDGPVSVAGAVGVNVELATAKAYIPDALTIHAGGMLTVQSATNVDGKASADGSAVISGVEFNPTSAVDTTTDTIDLDGTPGLKTGAAVEYKHGEGGSDIGGLTDGTTYFVYVNSGKIQLYDTKDHANAHGSDGLVDLTSKGSGTKHVLKGAGAGGTAVGAAIAINYAEDTNLAYIGQSTVEAGGLTLGAARAARDMAFDPASKVNATDNTIDAGDSGLRSGDAVVNRHGDGGSDTGGLADAHPHSVH